MFNLKIFKKKEEKKAKDKDSELKNLKENPKETRIEYFKKQAKKREAKRIIAQEKRHRLKFYIEKAGLGTNHKIISKRLFNLCVFINLAISAYLIYYFSVNFGYTWNKIVTAMLSLWVFVFTILLFTMWAIFYLSLDLKVFKRKIDIEDVLPDFLQLTASNIKAGMTIDRALWYAVRPRFGVLAKEIEQVAKETMSGKDLKQALQDFAAKYNSVVLKRSISLLIEGIEAGGEIGNLLIKISANIQETKIMKQEMSANVTTYVIFISFASVTAAPFLFALSGVLIQVIHGLGSTMGNVGGAASTGMALSFKGTGIGYSDFRIFAVVTLLITSFFSASIIATIKKGNIKAGFKYIPVFMISSISLYFIAQSILNLTLGMFF
ncbi:type II secretion system F family protein [Candidatus Woesearchaeota archaeon]|nr:type II secretion system F family protein [Candidatus Woesearchaeota archaeon]